MICQWRIMPTPQFMIALRQFLKVTSYLHQSTFHKRKCKRRLDFPVDVHAFFFLNFNQCIFNGLCLSKPRVTFWRTINCSEKMEVGCLVFAVHQYYLDIAGIPGKLLVAFRRFPETMTMIGFQNHFFHIDWTGIFNCFLSIGQPSISAQH